MAQSDGQEQTALNPSELDLALALLPREDVDDAVESSGGLNVWVVR